MPDTRDITFRIDRLGNPILSRRGEYVCNIAQLLFAMVPGNDEYEPLRGLNIHDHYKKYYSEGARDTEYETRIVEQFTAYTDIIPTNVVAMYSNQMFYVYMAVRWEDTIYEVDIGANTTDLSAMIRT